jgi:glycosyltransferase involved in cell wall biosynthesis
MPDMLDNSTRDTLRILVISRCPPYPLHWGDRLAIYHLTRELAQMGHIIDFLGFTQHADDVDYLKAYEHFYRDIAFLPETSRSPFALLERLLLPAKRFPKQESEAWSPDMWRLIEAMLTKNNYDVVHLFGGVHVYEFYRLLEQHKHAHNAIIMPYESYSLYLTRVLQKQSNLLNQVRLRLAQAYERFMFAPYRATTVLAEPDKQALLALNPDLDIRIIPNGIDLAYWQADDEDNQRDNFTLLFFGNFTYAPNIDAAHALLDDILPRVRDVLPDVRLELVGNAPPPELLARANDHIIVTGRVPDVRPYLQRVTVFVSPLRVGAGLKNKVLEAFAMGTPSIISPISADGIAVCDGEHALIADVDAMPERIIELLQNREQQGTLSKQARHLIESDYSTKQIAQAYLDIYHEAMP